MKAVLHIDGRKVAEVATLRNERILALIFNGRGINLHRRGGISITGLPSRGGTTLCWGALRRRCEQIDSEPQDYRPSPPPDTLITHGPLMLRVGSYF